METTRSPLRRIGGLASWLLLGAFLFVAWPAGFGGATNYTIVSGHSMDTTYATGDLIIGRARSSYKVGDVITYEVPKDQPGAGHRVVHRIVGGSDATGWITKGDNNEQTDFWRPRNDDVISATVVQIPKLGHVLFFLTSPMAWAMFGALVIGGLFWPSDDEDEEEVEPLMAPAGSPLPAM